jgi:hypothetical protein
MRTALVAGLGCVVAGCGLGWIDDDDSRGGVPTSGAGPYGRLPIDDDTPILEPILIGDRLATLSDPAALRRADGGLRIWMTYIADADPARTEIWYAEVPSEYDMPDLAPAPALVPDQPWEGGRVAAPSLVDHGDELVLYYEFGSPPAIGRATSTDDGATWTKHDPVLADAAAPSVVHGPDGSTWLFCTRPSAPGAIWRAVDDGAGFAFDAAPVIEPRPADAEAFDRTAVGDPFVLAITGADGRKRFGLWFTGTLPDPPDEPAVGYAGSYDGVTWERFLGPEPVLSRQARGPTVVLSPSHGLMLFAERDRGHLAIAAARHPQ